jgi:type II secretory pathway component PulM
MNELDPRIAELFARQQGIVPSEAFTAAVWRRVRRNRRAAIVLTVGAALCLAAVIGVALFWAPWTPLDTVRRAGQFLIRPEGTVASLLFSVVLFGVLRFADV